MFLNHIRGSVILHLPHLPLKVPEWRYPLNIVIVSTIAERHDHQGYCTRTR